MDTPKPKSEPTDIPQKIFGQFIAELKKTELSSVVINQLEEAIVTNGNFSEPILRAAQISKTEV